MPSFPAFGRVKSTLNRTTRCYAARMNARENDVRIRVLGRLGLVSTQGSAVRLPTRKAALLLAMLTLGAKGLRREALSNALWPDRGEAQARNSLRQALAAIRSALSDADPDIRLDSDMETVCLDARPEAVDLWHFEALAGAKDAQLLAGAAALYQGDVLAGVVLPDMLEQWFAPQRQACRWKALHLVERLSQAATDGGATGAACEALAERLLTSDPGAEEAHRALIRLRLAQGRRNAALRQLELCREALRRELDTEPEAETLALLREDVQTPVARPAHAAPPASLIVPPARAGDQPAIIVMPFDNLSGEGDGYFVDGVVEEITGALSRVKEFFVIARQSAFTYKGRFVDVREVGRELSVSYVVEGTIRRGGDRLRISVQLVDAETRAQIWSDRYEGATTDIFEFQDRIAAHVAGAILPVVRNAEIAVATRKHPGNLRAHDLVLQAYPRIWSHDQRDNSQAIVLLLAAVDADPQYGRAHALLAWCHSQDVVYLWSAEPEASRHAARIAVEAATGLIADDPTALAAVGAALSQCLDDLPRASSFIESALSLDPNNAWAWARYAWLAIYRMEPEEAIRRFERSLALSPLDPLAFNLRIGIAAALAYGGDHAEAAERLKEVIYRHPKVSWVYRILAYTAALSGDLRGAREAVRKLLEANPNTSIEMMKRSHPARHRPAVFEPMLDGWRLAGMPER
ncbi:BTAD domain-containing putative transcriptional regulator [Falsiroseomonas sp. E2-1-a20]|uniref:BTAD domain-containing putative transcriptional regulator n=1 Tax=Falsiroseomonas sp. E2-1-a20 TaxID=3239300 RepID=UPI003F3820C1